MSIKSNNKIMAKPGVIFISIISLFFLIAFGIYKVDVSSIVDDGRSTMISGMMGMMNTEPKDVIINVKSKQIIPVGKESEMKLLILDKDTQKPLTNANVIISIERGPSMSTMDMFAPMFEANEQKDGSGIYKIKFTPDEKGIYTLHIHVILSGESRHSMMENHLDIGLIAK